MFTVVATGVDLTYQWQADGVNLNDTDGRYAGTTTGNLIVSNIAEDDAALMFTCIVTNSAGSVTSSVARIIICKCVRCVYVYVYVRVCVSVCVCVCVCEYPPPPPQCHFLRQQHSQIKWLVWVTQSTSSALPPLLTTW